MEELNMTNKSIIFLFMAFYLDGYSLSDAIRESSALRVRELLANIRLTKQDKAKYLDIADNILKLRQSRLLLAEKLKSERRSPQIYLPQAQRKIYNFGFAACTITATIGLTSRWYLKQDNFVSTYFLPSSLIGALALYYKLHHANFNYLQESYDQALTIKELMYDKETVPEDGIIQFTYL